MALRIEIDGSWSAADFATFYQAANELYQFFLFDRDPFWLERGPYGRFIGYRRYSAEVLQVKKIQFASPGFTDLAGIAAAMRELRELIQFTLLLYIGRKDRELKQIEIAEKKLALLKKLRELPDFPPGRAEDYEALLGVRDSQLPNIDPIIRGVIEGRIVGCKNVESDAGKE